MCLADEQLEAQGGCDDLEQGRHLQVGFVMV